MRIKGRCESSFGADCPRLISGVSRLTNTAGLMLRAVGIESDDMGQEVRRFWRAVREEVRGRTLPEESFCT